MNLLKQSALAWKSILDYKYHLVYGYKKRLFHIYLTFSSEDYPHLAGFQYLKDISLPNYSSKKIIDKIIEEKIPFEKVQKSASYNDMIKPRLEAIIHLKDALDNEFNLFSFIPYVYPFSTTIHADYLISSHFLSKNYYFIIQSNSQGNSFDDFLCCSAFQKGERNYEINQRLLKLLKKERVHISTNTTDILFNKLNIEKVTREN